MAFPAFLSELFDALNHEMGQRFDVLGRMIDDRFATVDRQFAGRDALFARLETKTAQIAEMDVRLERLETKTPTEVSLSAVGFGHRDRTRARLGNESDPRLVNSMTCALAAVRKIQAQRRSAAAAELYLSEVKISVCTSAPDDGVRPPPGTCHNAPADGAS